MSAELERVGDGVNVYRDIARDGDARHTGLVLRTVDVNARSATGNAELVSAVRANRNGSSRTTTALIRDPTEDHARPCGGDAVRPVLPDGACHRPAGHRHGHR